LTPQCSIIGDGVERSAEMFWTGLFTGFAACLVVVLVARLVQDRRQRLAFIASLSPLQRENLRGFESFRGNWHEFRDLLHSAER
jgi:hypothetical protein